jgi:hypothetical protein
MKWSQGSFPLILPESLEFAKEFLSGHFSVDGDEGTEPVSTAGFATTVAFSVFLGPKTRLGLP